jgi:hypothetical protein
MATKPPRLFKAGPKQRLRFYVAQEPECRPPCQRIDPVLR